MEKKLDRKIERAVAIGILILILAAIRFFEKDLFYDPLIEFFESNYLLGIIPPMHMAELMFNLTLRYFLNTAISLAIIYIGFRNMNMVKFAVVLYVVLYVLVTLIFIYLVLNIEKEHFLALFYVRRFLIHPLFLLILLPAFYYYRLTSKKKS